MCLYLDISQRYIAESKSGTEDSDDEQVMNWYNLEELGV